MPTFSIPDNGLTYIETILSRARELIEIDVWAGITLPRLSSWLSNFTGDLERYFAACLLDHLIYRSKDQTVALIFHLFERALADLTRLDPPSQGPISDWTTILSREYTSDPGIRLVTAVQQGDPPTKSAYYIARLMKQHVFIAERLMIQPSQVAGALASGVNTFILIDDFLGTGHQLSELLNREGLLPYLDQAYFAYAPLTAHQHGISFLSRFPSLRVTCAELLTPAHSLFHPTATCFTDGINTTASALDFYHRLLSDKGIGIVGPDRHGYGDLALAYIFDHAAPDNCLPLLWWPPSTGWQPLFLR